LVKLSKQFGPVFGFVSFNIWFYKSTNSHNFLIENKWSIQLGTTPVLVLNDWPSIKEAFSKDALNGRPKDILFNSLTSQISNHLFNLNVEINHFIFP
jgi:hypothetical protein